MVEDLRWLAASSGASQRRYACALLIAGVVHAGLAAAALRQDAPPARATSVTEVALQRPAPPPADEPPASEPEPKPSAPPVPQPAAPSARRVARARAARPAAAAPLRTVDEAVKTAEEPVRFVTDPSGTMFGYGTVARGGSGVSALAGAALPSAPAPTSGRGEGPAPALSRPPQLGESDPCRGFFPARAQVDRGEVALKVRVDAEGRVRSVQLSRESPAAQGFGFAARDCLMSKRFSPALDRAGVPVAVTSPVTVRFSR